VASGSAFAFAQSAAMGGAALATIEAAAVGTGVAAAGAAATAGAGALTVEKKRQPWPSTYRVSEELFEKIKLSGFESCPRYFPHFCNCATVEAKR